MYSGVGKSGSPAPNPMTGRPAALSDLALASTARVADSAIPATRSESLCVAGIPVDVVMGALFHRQKWPRDHHSTRSDRKAHGERRDPDSGGHEHNDSDGQDA